MSAHTWLVLIAAIMAVLGLGHLVLWYTMIILVKAPDNHRLLWHSHTSDARSMAETISQLENVPTWLIRIAIISRGRAIAGSLLSAAVFLVFVVVDKIR